MRCLLKLVFAVNILMVPVKTPAQDTIPKAFQVSGYIETYYSYDFSKPRENVRPSFLYNHNRHNEVNINLAFVKCSYDGHRSRGNLAIAVGTYMNANYSAEPGTLRNIYEANVGYKLSNTKNIWIDAGILPSHIGFETAKSNENPTLSRSLVAENSPYFEAGAKLSYVSKNEKLTLALLVLNGWQRIRRLEGNSLVSLGTQLTFKPDENSQFNYSTFFGADSPDSTRRYRIYHNLYGIFQIAPKLKLSTGLDVGLQQKSMGANKFNSWISPVAIFHYKFNSRWAASVRSEYFRDAHQVIIVTGIPRGFRTAGFSLNSDHKPNEKLSIRLELRYLRSREKIFKNDAGAASRGNLAIASSLAIDF